MNIDKKMKGQFFTITNPFNHDLFFSWVKNIKGFKSKVILEPFAGCNNIVDLVEEIGFINKWECFDIDEECSLLTEEHDYPVKTRDTLNSFPIGHDVIITNPPYLAKNSATRSGIEFPLSQYDDLYKISLNLMLNNSKYVAAIIPESFITQGLFHNRLFGIVSLTMKMFEDTACPVCLALFVPEKEKDICDDFLIYSGDRLIGNYAEMREFLQKPKQSINIKFNNPNGNIGLIAIDNTNGPSIRFVNGEDIDSDKIKSTSRSITRISIENINEFNLNEFIDIANNILFNEREITSDLFFTAFKGLRKDGKYRRRLDYKNAKRILTIAYEEINV